MTRALHPLEWQVQKAIIEAFWFKYRIRLDHIDAGCAAMRSGSTEGFEGHSSIPAGFLDLLGCIPPNGTMISIEVKRSGQKPTPIQMAFLERRRQEGGIAFWASSVNSAVEQFEAAWQRRAA